MNQQIRMRLFNCISAIDDRFLDEAEEYASPITTSRQRAVKYGTAGVVVSLALAAVLLGIRTKQKRAA